MTAYNESASDDLYLDMEAETEEDDENQEPEGDLQA